MKIAACIITFNPDINRLKKNIEFVFYQVEKIFLYDNGSENLMHILEICKSFSKDRIEILANHENLGLPINLNDCLKKCNEQNFEWLLTLDQDSICDENLVMIYKELILEKNDLKIISFTPEILEDRISQELTNIDISNVLIDKCITSGNMIKVNEIIKIGGFDESYFIDNVDFDLCARIIINGYKIMKTSKTYIHHTIGDSKEHRIILKKIVSYNHSPIRVYYIFRNTFYYNKKYNKYKDIKIKYRFFLKKLIIIVLYEKEKIKKIFYAIKGYIDFKKNKLGRKK